MKPRAKQKLWYKIINDTLFTYDHPVVEEAMTIERRSPLDREMLEDIYDLRPSAADDTTY